MQEYIDFFQNHMILSMLWVGLAITLVMTLFKSATAKYKTISPVELTQFINRENGVVFDIRKKEEFNQGHISGSVLVSPEDIKSGSISSLEKHKSNPIIVVCKSGTAAQESANLLVKAGFERVNVLKNGLISWDEAKMPVVRGKKK